MSCGHPDGIASKHWKQSNYQSALHYVFTVSVALFLWIAYSEREYPDCLIPNFLLQCSFTPRALQNGLCCIFKPQITQAQSIWKLADIQTLEYLRGFPKGWPVHWFTETMQTDVAMRGMSAKTVGCTLIMERDCATRLTGLTLFKSN